MGSPISGVSVQVRDAVTDALFGATVTDIDGHYSFAGLAEEAQVTVRPSLGSYSFTPSSASFTMDADKTADFAVVVPPTYSISGTVTYSGSPMSGVEVEARDLSTNALLGAVATDMEGHYSFTGLEDGAQIKVTPSQYGYTFTPASSSLTMDSDKTADFTATQVTYSLSGTVRDYYDSPFAGVTVSIYDQGSLTFIDSATTDEEGNYSFAAIAEGRAIRVVPTYFSEVFTPTWAEMVMTGNMGQDFGV
jgi:hypothetical protein